MVKVENFSNKKLWDEVYQGFDNDICFNCRWYTNKINKRKMSNPQPIPYVGPKFINDKFGLMFVGIETYGNDIFKKWDIINYDDFSAERVDELFFWRNRKEESYSPFWGWVKEISTNVLNLDPEESFKHIAYSNLLKCQSRKKASKFYEPDREHFEAVAVNCIQRARWIFKEIKRINPKNVIVFSGNDDYHYLARLFLNDPEGIIIKQSNIFNKRNLLVYLTDDKRNYLITRHPRGTNKYICEEIIDIIKGVKKIEPTYWKMY